MAIATPRFSAGCGMTLDTHSKVSGQAAYTDPTAKHKKAYFTLLLSTETAKIEAWVIYVA